MLMIAAVMYSFIGICYIFPQFLNNVEYLVFSFFWGRSSSLSVNPTAELEYET